MNKAIEYINSGVLELYVLGQTSAEETLEVNAMAKLYPEVETEINQITKAFEIDSASKHEGPNDTVKPYLMAIVDYTERLKAGESMTFPPLLTSQSKVVDFKEWTSRLDMILPDDFEEMYAKIIGYTPEATTAILWIKTKTPFEIHTHEYERFLILEGSCDIIIDNDIHKLIAGDFMAIPLHLGHTITVTSSIPCKVILQRVAA